jgi:transposase
LKYKPFPAEKVEQLRAAGLSYRAIARALETSDATVRRMVRQTQGKPPVEGKLNASD